MGVLDSNTYTEATVGIPLLCRLRSLTWVMTEFISEDDMNRIAEFVATPQYERDPEQLVPNGEN